MPCRADGFVGRSAEDLQRRDPDPSTTVRPTRVSPGLGTGFASPRFHRYAVSGREARAPITRARVAEELAPALSELFGRLASGLEAKTLRSRRYAEWRPAAYRDTLRPATAIAPPQNHGFLHICVTMGTWTTETNAAPAVGSRTPALRNAQARISQTRAYVNEKMLLPGHSAKAWNWETLRSARS